MFIHYVAVLGKQDTLGPEMGCSCFALADVVHNPTCRVKACLPA